MAIPMAFATAARKRQGYMPTHNPFQPSFFIICLPQSKKPPSNNHLLALQVPGSETCRIVLIKSCGQENIQQFIPAKVPTISPYPKVRARCYLLTIFYFKNSQAANCAPQAKISLKAVEQDPLNRPRKPSFFNISFAHSVEFLYLKSLSSCIRHLTSQTGDTTIVFTRPAKAPFQMPFAKLNSVLLVIFLKSSQEENTIALMRGTVIRGQYIPLKRCRNPSFLIIVLSDPTIVRE